MHRINTLRKEITKHDELYAKGQPIITDTEYDTLYNELVQLEINNPEMFDKDSPTQKITPVVVDGIEKSDHREPMLSLRDVNDKEGIDKFLSGEDEILMQDKMDGITIVLTYNNGQLIKAVTRGDSRTGDDLTHNIEQIPNVPKRIAYKGDLEVRGEVILPFKEFERINKDGKYSNPRNTVAGAVRRHDSNVMLGVGYKVIVFNLEYSEDLIFDTDKEQIDFLAGQGFEMVRSQLMDISTKDKKDELFETIKIYEEVVRPTLPFMIDGLVFKVNDISKRKEYGTTSKFPKWALAYKFESLDATTTLTEIINQVGKSGQITPVAVFDEVDIDGTKVTRSTLSNFGIVKQKDLRIGDKILVERANDVIPQIVKSFDEARDGTEEVIKIPSTCPICGSDVQHKGANLFCIGLECPAQLEGKIAHFAKRDAMNIGGLGEKTVSVLHQAGIVESILDIYKLEDKRDEIMELDGFGKASADRLIEGAEESKSRGLNHLLYGLSMDNVGRSASRDLMQRFKSLRKMIELSKNPKEFKEELLEVPAFGEVLSQAVVDFFSDDKNIETMEEFIELGLKTEDDTEDTPVKESGINGLTFVVTGKVNNYANRNELKTEIQNLGGKVTGSVSDNTDYLINNDKESNTSKNKDAKDKNIPIINEDELEELMR